MKKQPLTPKERKEKSKAVFERMIQSVFGGKKEEYTFECHLKKELEDADTRREKEKTTKGSQPTMVE